jgi:site-specific DNA-methyltransferase (adenine-specific)
MLAEAVTIQKAKELKDLALTAADWARRKGMGQEAVKYANSYAVQAEIRIGEMLKVTSRAKPGPKRDRLLGVTDLSPTLKEIGITKRESVRAQKLAELDDDKKEEILQGKNTVGKAVKEHKNTVKQAKRKEQLTQATKSYKESEDIKIYFGDCLTVTKKEVKANSVDLILTDPPYPYEFIECWSKLSELAEYALKPSGLVIAMSGQLYLPEVISRMQKHLEYYWTVGLKLIGQHQIVHPVNIQCGWKPIFIFQKAPKKKLGYCPLDYLESAPVKEKADHEWQQDLSIFETLVNKFSEPGGLVLDPFAGSGTTLLACKNLKRKVIGVEIDKDMETVIKGRII